MLASLKLQASLAGLFAILLGASLAQGQAPIYGDPRPVSNPGGFAGSELSNIYRQDVGTGYSASSINRQTLLNSRINAPYLGSGQVSRPQARIGLGVGSSMAGKPFSDYSPEPTVSPYLNLFREDFDGTSDFNYQALVRPMLQQQQFNRQMQRQTLEMASRMQSMAARSDFNPQGSESQFPTGHQTVFMYYGHYYPMPRRR